MRKFAILMPLALVLAVSGCGSNTPPGTVTTTTSGNWEARLIGGTGPSSQLNFVTTFTVTNTNGGSSELDIPGFSFFNSGPCFAVGTNTENKSGSATITVQSNGQVTGNMTYSVTSVAANGVTGGNNLTLTSQTNGFTGTFTGSSPTTGSISNGVVVGTWTLDSSDPNCTGNATKTGTFVMCQGNTTCTPP